MKMIISDNWSGYVVCPKCERGIGCYKNSSIIRFHFAGKNKSKCPALNKCFMEF